MIDDLRSPDTFDTRLGKRVSANVTPCHVHPYSYSPNRPFAVYDHMVQKPPSWRANYPLGHPKQKNIKLSCFVLDVPVDSLLSSMAVFLPCDRKLQRAYSSSTFVSIQFNRKRKSFLFLMPYLFLMP